MSIGHRYGMAAGCALQPFVFRILFGYQTHDLASLSPWLWIAAPLVAWFALENSARVWRRARLLGQALAAVGVVAAGTWGWWLHGLFAWGGSSTIAGLAIPIAVVLVYVALATVSGRLLAGKRTRASQRIDDEFEPIPY